MAVTAVGVEVGARPGLQRLPCVSRVGDFSFPRSRGGVERGERHIVRSGSADVSRLGQGDKLVALVKPGTVQLLRKKRQGVFRLVAVARHALAAAVELPQARPAGGQRRGVADFYLSALGGNQISIRLIVPPGERVSAPVHAVVM